MYNAIDSIYPTFDALEQLMANNILKYKTSLVLKLHTDQSVYDGKRLGLTKCIRIRTNYNRYIAGEGITSGQTH